MMSQHPTYRLEQILGSINELRATLRGEDSSCGQIKDLDFDQLIDQPNDKWFEDCEYDPR